MGAFVQRLKQKWGITSNLDFILIMVVFSLAGMMVTLGRKPIFALFGITDQTPFAIKVLVYIPVVFPLYQLGLVVFGFLFGQFDFFWEKQKQIGGHLLRLLKLK